MVKLIPQIMIIGQAVSDYSQISCSNLDMLPLADVTEFYGQVPGEAFFASVLAEFTRGELLFFFFFLATLRSLWDLSSPTRN